MLFFFLETRITYLVHVCFLPQTSFGIAGSHQTTRSCIMETWKKALREKCPTIPCRTNVSGHPGQETRAGVAWLFPGRQISRRRTVPLQTATGCASSRCESRLEQSRDPSPHLCPRGEHTPWLECSAHGRPKYGCLPQGPSAGTWDM